MQFSQGLGTGLQTSVGLFLPAEPPHSRLVAAHFAIHPSNLSPILRQSVPPPPPPLPSSPPSSSPEPQFRKMVCSHYTTLVNRILSPPPPPLILTEHQIRRYQKKRLPGNLYFPTVLCLPTRSAFLDSRPPSPRVLVLPLFLLNSPRPANLYDPRRRNTPVVPDFNFLLMHVRPPTENPFFLLPLPPTTLKVRIRASDVPIGGVCFCFFVVFLVGGLGGCVVLWLFGVGGFVWVFPPFSSPPHFPELEVSSAQPLRRPYKLKFSVSFQPTF